MDDAVGGLVAIAELVAALVAFLIELLAVLVELLILLVEFAIWGIAALIGRKRPRPQRRHLGRPSRLSGTTRRGLSYLIVFGAIALFFGGRGIYRHYFTAELNLRGTLGIRASAVEVEWINSEGETKKESIKSPTRYLKSRWDELRITDEAYQPKTVTLTKTDQTIQLQSRHIKKVIEDSIDKISTTAGEALEKTHDSIDSRKVSDFLKKKIKESIDSP